MRKSMNGLTALEIAPGTLIAYFGSTISCIGVVFERDAWAKLASSEIPDTGSIVENQEYLTLRILGGALGGFGDGRKWRTDPEPNQNTIRNYCYTNINAYTCIIDDLRALQEAFYIISRVYDFSKSDVVYDLKLLVKYLAGELIDGCEELGNMYGKKMLAVFQKGIPLM